ncbi:Xaa-Pro peptidase family protein, partial [Desulfovibrio sp. OttesenSCG-928-G15]|nr:Xaa-Pro peptidase family protein [Desulfovibrio sp. OttesenSCG-928-G15]
ALADNPQLAVAQYRSFGDLPDILAAHDLAVPRIAAAEQAALPWSFAQNLQKKLPDTRFSSGDTVLAQARAHKTPYEIAVMRESCARQTRAMEEILPQNIQAGMTEFAIACKLSDIFYSLGSCGLNRMANYGAELIFGSCSVGDNANYPTFYDGPVGALGVHPSSAFLGSAQTVWEKSTLLIIDTALCYRGYNSDQTICYYAGTRDTMPDKAKMAHAACMEIEETIARDLQPGALPFELYQKAQQMARKAGIEEGFMGLGGNKVSFLGHGIGLCVDEWPVLAPGFNKPLEAGMTIAIEPKVGIPGFGMVGTENTWLVKENGAECLTGGIRDIFYMP